MNKYSMWDTENLVELAHQRAEQELRDGVNVYKFDGSPVTNMLLLMQNHFDEAQEYLSTAEGQIVMWLYLMKFFDNWYVTGDKIGDIAVDIASEVLEQNTTDDNDIAGGAKVLDYSKSCQDYDLKFQLLISEAKLDPHQIYASDGVYKQITTVSGHYANSFIALMNAYKLYKRANMTPDEIGAPVDVIADTKAYYSYLCDKYYAFLKVEELERKRLTWLIAELHKAGVENTSALEVLEQRINRLNDLANNIDATIDLLLYLITCVKVSYDLKRLEDLNKPLVKEIDNYTSARASFKCELQFFLTSLDKAAMPKYRDLLYLHSWGYWQEGAEP